MVVSRHMPPTRSSSTRYVCVANVVWLLVMTRLINNFERSKSIFEADPIYGNWRSIAVVLGPSCDRTRTAGHRGRTNSSVPREGTVGSQVWS